MTTLRCLILILVCWVNPLVVFSQSAYQAGDVVDDVTLINRRTGLPVSLREFSGKVLFLDFFAHWCTVCNAAAPQLDAGVYERYSATGNAAGVPVVYILCNLQSDASSRDRTGTDGFIARFGEDAVVLQDTSRALQRRFTSSGGQPTFAIINGVADSPSHRQWELVYSLHGYTSPGRVQPIEEFQQAIDRVLPAAAPTPVSVTRAPDGQSVTAGASVSLSVTATGSDPITYQWLRNGELIVNATGSELHWANVAVGDTGDYSVRITNPAGTVETAPARLTVQAAPVAPIQILRPRFQAVGTFYLDFIGQPGRTYWVEISANLESWTVLQQVTAGSGVVSVPDPLAGSVQTRFYRVRSN